VYGLLFTKICTNPEEAEETLGAKHVTELLVVSDAGTRVVLKPQKTLGDCIVSSNNDPLRTMGLPPRMESCGGLALTRSTRTFWKMKEHVKEAQEAHNQ
jgi:hypothetical protein